VDKTYLMASLPGFRAFQNFPADSPKLRTKLRAMNPVWKIRRWVLNSPACPASYRRANCWE
jgi:hypothetical protein